MDELTVPCPTCGAAPGIHCHASILGVTWPRRRSHLDRVVTQLPRQTHREYWPLGDIPDAVVAVAKAPVRDSSEGEQQ